MAEFNTIYLHGYETKTGKRPTLRDRADMRKSCGPYQWKPSEPGKGRGFYQSSRGLWCGDSTFDLRLELANNHISGRMSGIDGYYTSEDCDETLQPIVARLPHNRGFLAGWTMGAGMCASLDADVYETVEDAALAAHHIADRDAEREREYQAKQRDDGGKND